MNRRGGASSNREAPSVDAPTGPAVFHGRFSSLPGQFEVSIARCRGTGRRRWCKRHSFTGSGLRRCITAGEPRNAARRSNGGCHLDGDRGSAGRGSRPCPVDQCRAQLRRRLRRPDRGHTTEHRGDRPGRPTGAARRSRSTGRSSTSSAGRSAGPTTSSSGSSRRTGASSTPSSWSSRGRSPTRPSRGRGTGAASGTTPTPTSP